MARRTSMQARSSQQRCPAQRAAALRPTQRRQPCTQHDTHWRRRLMSARAGTAPRRSRGRCCASSSPEPAAANTPTKVSLVYAPSDPHLCRHPRDLDALLTFTCLAGQAGGVQAVMAVLARSSDALPVATVLSAALALWAPPLRHMLALLSSPRPFPESPRVRLVQGAACGFCLVSAPPACLLQLRTTWVRCRAV